MYVTSAEYNYYLLLQRIPEIISAGSDGLFVSLWNCCLQWIIATERGAYTNWLVQFIWSVCLMFKYLKGHIKSMYIYMSVQWSMLFQLWNRQSMTSVSIVVVKPTIHDKHVCCCCCCVCVRARAWVCVGVCGCVYVCLIVEHVPPCIKFQQIYLLQVTNTETASQIITVHRSD